MQETRVQSLGQKDHLKKEMATCSSILPGNSTEREPGGLQSMGSQRVEHDWARVHLRIHTHTNERYENTRNQIPLWEPL